VLVTETSIDALNKGHVLPTLPTVFTLLYLLPAGHDQSRRAAINLHWSLATQTSS